MHVFTENTSKRKENDGFGHEKSWEMIGRSWRLIYQFKNLLDYMIFDKFQKSAIKNLKNNFRNLAPHLSNYVTHSPVLPFRLHYKTSGKLSSFPSKLSMAWSWQTNKCGKICPCHKWRLFRRYEAAIGVETARKTTQQIGTIDWPTDPVSSDLSWCVCTTVAGALFSGKARGCRMVRERKTTPGEFMFWN